MMEQGGSLLDEGYRRCNFGKQKGKKKKNRTREASTSEHEQIGVMTVREV